MNFLYGVDPQPEKGFWLRHDEDWSMEYSLRMARWEARSGYRATYFLNHSCTYFDYSSAFLDQCKEIVALGHNIGLHTNIVEEHLLTGRPPLDILLEPLRFFADNGIEVAGAAAHGSRICSDNGLLNAEIWREFATSCCAHLKHGGRFAGVLPFERFSLADFGLRYEASILDHDAFISDSSGRLWGFYKNVAPTQNHVYDLLEYAELLNMPRVIKNNVHEVVVYFNRMMEAGFLQVLAHPKWWLPEHLD